MFLLLCSYALEAPDLVVHPIDLAVDGTVLRGGGRTLALRPDVCSSGSTANTYFFGFLPGQ